MTEPETETPEQPEKPCPMCLGSGKVRNVIWRSSATGAPTTVQFDPSLFGDTFVIANICGT